MLFHRKAREVVRTFPEDVRKVLGKAILDLQAGYSLGFPLSRLMSSISKGVEELRTRDAAGAYRVFYLCGLPRGVLVFHAFVKKTQATPHREIKLAMKRLREMLDEEN